MFCLAAKLLVTVTGSIIPDASLGYEATRILGGKLFTTAQAAGYSDRQYHTRCFAGLRSHSHSRREAAYYVQHKLRLLTLLTGQPM